MNKFSKRLAVAFVTCTAVGLTACQAETKPENKPAASAPAPAADSDKMAAAEPATPPAAETPAAETPPAPAPETKSEATPPPAASEPEKPADSSSSAATTPPASSTPEPEKTAEAPAAPAPDTNSQPATPPAPAPAPAESTAPAATPPAQTADAAATTGAEPGARKPDGDAVTPNPVSELAKTTDGVKWSDGRYRNKDGEPVPVVTKDYMVDWGTWNGFRRYHDACHVCHGPNALGSTFAPALADSLKTMDYSTFIATVSGGKKENKGGTMFVMPSFGEDRNIMCYIDDIYTYIKARSIYSASGGKAGMPPGRPNGREDISPETKKAADECTG